MERQSNNPNVVMIGAFPPPVHGMATINAAVRRQLCSTGVVPIVIDVAAVDLNRSLHSRLGRAPRVLRALLHFALLPGLRNGTLYMSVSGGSAQLYEILFVLLARWRTMRIYLHHHSFAYLDAPSWITSRLATAAGPAATHIALSPRMAAGLSRLYPAIQRTVSISNAAFLALDSNVSKPLVRTQLRTLGYLSNISAEKGVFEFLDLVDAARAKDMPLKGKLAGPFQDDNTERQVRARLTRLPEVEYVGPKYEADKLAFLAEIDVLVFPTRYANEAEPLVMHEAMRSGLPIIAYARGAIGEVDLSSCGLSISPHTPFVAHALTYLERWLIQPALLQAMSRSAMDHFETLCRENTARWEILLASLVGSMPVPQQHCI